MVAAVERECEPPFTASIYYQDWDGPRTEVYRDAGWRVVSFGPRYRPTFLLQLAMEIAAHQTVVSNLVQSAVMYSALLERRLRILGPRPDWLGTSLNPGNIVDSPLRYPALFGEGLSGEGSRALGQAELGWDAALPPSELADALGWSSRVRSAEAFVFSRFADLVHGRNLRLGTSDTNSSQG